MILPPLRPSPTTSAGGVPPQPQNVSVNTGDTVVWVNAFGYGPDYVESYEGDWKSPPLDAGASFSVTFINPGFYAYRTSESAYTGRTSGTVTVSGWTNQPPRDHQRAHGRLPLYGA